ncbi:xanthine dehydrogenase accessory protein XdhC [bacterium (Candidatus Blackallbacteria) CG17_big_fil_post_rev_8_21_14_2_50_48_46]|uniref:Xanthine dehydrogenase accessory protein XdhC n=1 Tax=bacterium (Candidatus Blackallbacteria) CG17_big_fil_post_rev_8_21_14_2_50_48_46 TaxID=2014261 RepID=A0A2M7G6M0_9BACT|nr:MAG: hypothetical protein COW64_06300 [bacterium (Candidatus Blackallbacteria) CG18_big_fil_WC_8_21_14_2_50_49_26]PIW17703.1 MAG: xanthine dehydrogenase accessory protein XdhC [bacterium (Candidatus Blackallbacteria) CG17_big_fil_post_rev_8_21_14_2_50_48_46]PIW47519.1 MAG: xanthine dehydrogenase accessory protein XdhC [bacterium (Candidatus Blackallbacteria) CG13_big_fil_rev_8_21_14_2_50_49_14]
MDPKLELYDRLPALLKSGQDCVMAILVAITGSAPQIQGARVLVNAQGLVQGTIGGGKIEARVIAEAQDLLKSNDHFRFHEWNLQTEIGMTCGGLVKIYFEAFRISRWEIAVYGAGHVAQALIPLLLNLDCQLQCFDPRAEWLERLPEHPRLKCQQLANMAESVASLAPETFLLSLTMGHAHDLPILETALKRKHTEPKVFPFLGVIGSPAKAGVLQRELRQRGLSQAEIETIRCPIGLALGNNQPAEIAISIAAQLLQERDQYFGKNKWEQPGYRSHPVTGKDSDP